MPGGKLSAEIGYKTGGSSDFPDYHNEEEESIIEDGRVCNKCSEWKTHNEFYLNKYKKLRSECKRCANNKALERFREKMNLKDVDFIISRMASALITRTKSVEGYYAEKGVKNKLGNHAEIVKIIKSIFSVEVRQILDAGESPSIDRINPDGDYELSNIRVISDYENRILGLKTGAENRKKKLKCVYPDGSTVIFNSVNDAHDITGLDRATIRSNMLLNRKTKAGYFFEEIIESEAV